MVPIQYNKANPSEAEQQENKQKIIEYNAKKKALQNGLTVEQIFERNCLLSTGYHYGQLAVANYLLATNHELEFINQATKLNFAERTALEEEIAEKQDEPRDVDKELQVTFAANEALQRKASHSTTLRNYYIRTLLLQERVELIKDGYDESRIEIAQNLLDMDMMVSEVAKATGNDLGVIIELKRNGLSAALYMLDLTKENERLQRAKNFLLLGMNTKETAAAVELPVETIAAFQKSFSSITDTVVSDHAEENPIPERTALTNSAKNNAFEEGKLEIKLQIAKNCLLMDMNPELIAKVTELSNEKIVELQKSLPS